MSEIRRSLQTYDLKEARERCLGATAWFRTEMERLREMPAPTRAELEHAAQRYFEGLADDWNAPRQYGPESMDHEIGYQIEQSREVISELDDQLKVNMFSTYVSGAAERMITAAGINFDTLGDRDRLFAQQLCARAEREAVALFIHLVSDPARRYQHYDELFSSGPIEPRQATQIVDGASPGSIADRSQQFLGQKKSLGVGNSQITELGRVFRWIIERTSQDAPLTAMDKKFLREFRDDLKRLDRRLQGREKPFADRLTNQADHQIVHATAIRYWKSVQAFVAWCHAEGFLTSDPSFGLKMNKPKGERKKTPEPFTEAELRQLFNVPLYKGYQSPKRTKAAGVCRTRAGHWWSGVLLMYTGLRGGELSQLLPSDFVFEAEIPHLKVRLEDEAGVKLKTAKTASSIRDVPLSQVLLQLGLRQFIERRAKQVGPQGRIFREFRLGTLGKTSEGITRFWGDLLKDNGLWKEGRATHVWRHTVIACLRRNEVPAEDISAFVGHSRGTVTEGYGGAYPLSRKLKTVERLDYGIDIVEVLGGPYNAAIHGS